MTEGPVDATRTLAVMKSTFGYSSFRPLQEEIVSSILRGSDVFVLMPTGGGKSMCYQLPALLLEGTTVVVSPLIALMKDQVDALRTLGVAATFINSSLDLSEVRKRQGALARGDLNLLYVAPERLMMAEFIQLLGTTRISFFAIDEAHCISEWGHDFRPEYRELGRLRQRFPGVPLGAFTATATTRVRADIKLQLQLGEAASFRGSFNRSNLHYEVRPKKRAYDQLAAYLRPRADVSGIVYCLSRAGTDDLAARLRADGFSAAAYHAGLTAEERRSRQDQFVKDDVRIIVATVAFGMGIDKPDVRFVVHYDLPKTLENYYQESGRAGRDGEPSDSILFYSYADVQKYQSFIEEKSTPEERRTASLQLRQMADWADSTVCRRRTLLSYFDEVFDGHEDNCCDICNASGEVEDFTVPAQKFLACVKRTGERFGMTHVIGILRGSRSQRVLSLGHDKIKTFGIGRDRSDDYWRYVCRALVQSGHLQQTSDEFKVLKVTDRGDAVLFRGEKVHLRAVPPAPTVSLQVGDQPNEDLFERLRAVRKQAADILDVPPYVIFHDRTLRHMAAKLPATTEDFLRISGVGRRKAAEFGELFLSQIAMYVQETGAKPVALSAHTPPRASPRTRLSETVKTTLELHLSGQTVQEIVEARGLAPSTIEGHLASAIEIGELTEIDGLVRPDKVPAIETALGAVGSEYLSGVLEHLGDGYTYGEVRIVVAMQRRAARQSPS